jgi:hypothetical protein
MKMNVSFEVGKTYKLMVSKGYEQNSIYTLKVDGVDENFVYGLDKKLQRRGIKLDAIIDWVELNDGDDFGGNEQ